MPGKVAVPREFAQSSGTRRRCSSLANPHPLPLPQPRTAGAQRDRPERRPERGHKRGKKRESPEGGCSCQGGGEEALLGEGIPATATTTGAPATAGRDRTLYCNDHFPPIIQKMAGVGKRTNLRDVNPYLICPLCRGYLIDATTVVECLHSFCRSCILKHLNTEAHCPSCKHVLNKAKPNIKADKALQDIVYKLVPGLYHKEMRKRREFYKKHPEHADFATPEQRGEDVSGRLIFAPEDAVSLSLEYLPPGADPLSILLSTNDDTTSTNSTSTNSNNNNNSQNSAGNRRYLQCPALVAIAHLKKFLALKYGVDMTRYSIEICHRRAPLPEHWTLMDVAYIYAWKRNAPMRFFYRVTLEEQRLEAPPHERPSTPGLGASLPPTDATVTASEETSPKETSTDKESKVEAKKDEVAIVEKCAEVPKAEIVKSEVPKIEVVKSELSKVEVAKSEVPKTEIAKVEVSKTEIAKVEVPKAEIIKVEVPKTEIIKVEVPKVEALKARVPKIEVPKAQISKTQISKAQIPKAQIPKVQVPKPTSSPSSDPKIAIEKKEDITTKPSTDKPMSTVTVTSVATTTTVAISTMSAPTTTSATNTVTTAMSTESPKQIKTPIKILKNPDGRYEVLRSPSGGWAAKDQSPNSTDAKSSSPEFSVVSIGSGQNSNGVKITLKQCTPTNTSPNKPKVISNVLLHCGQIDKESSGALVLQQLQREREKQQAEKQEKQRRRVTFMEGAAPEKPAVNSVPTTAVLKKPGEQQEKKQFLQGFQLTAKEREVDAPAADIKPITKDTNTTTAGNETKNNASAKKVQDTIKSELSINTEDLKKKTATENTSPSSGGITVTNGKHTAAVNNVTANSNVRVNLNKCNDTESRGFSYNKSANTPVTIAANNPAKMDVYTFSNDPPIVPAGAVKRKCPPGLPIFDIKRRKQQPQSPTVKKQQSPSSQNNVKSPRKPATENAVPAKRPVNIVTEAGPSRTPTTPTSSKPSSGPMLSNDTRNLLDGCGLNIPASLSITLTAPKSPGNSGGGGFAEPNEPKDSRKGMLGKVSPSITLNDRSVDPRVLKALKAGQIRMPAPTKPVRQAKQAEREVNQQRQSTPAKRKREQDSRDILDLSGGKKADIHPLRIPQPVAKLKPKPNPRDSLPNMADQGQVVTLMGGHRYYRAPPGSLTPAAHRVTDMPLPTPARTPVYAPGLSSLGGPRSNTNLSSVFPSLQSLYALSQAPNLQQFHMDARLRLSRGNETNTSTAGSTENRSTSINVPGKSHLAAQCAPVKPARSSVAPLAVPIAKQPTNDRANSTPPNRVVPSEAKSPPVFRSNESLDSTDSTQQLSVQTKCSPVPEPNSRFSPRGTPNSSTNCTSNESQTPTATEAAQESSAESVTETKKEPEDSSRPQHHREAASPRVSSTASPSPPPGDATTNSPPDEGSNSNADNNVANTTNESDNDVPAAPSQSSANTGAEVSSSKSPASPDSSSITIESPTSKSCSVVEQGPSSPTQTEPVKSSEPSSKPEYGVAGDSTSDEKNASPTLKIADSKQLTSEMFQKRLLAAFPSDEWANNPLAAEHLGNFLKSLNASMKSETKIENNASEKVESQSDNARTINEASSKPRADVTE